MERQVDLYLIRHALAYDRDTGRWPDDAERPLTERGERRFRRAARGLRQVAPKVDVVLSSPFTRAWQTAQILEREAGWPAPRPCQGLMPGHAPAEAIAALGELSRAGRVALVGHEPSLHELASYLVTGDPAIDICTFSKGGVARIRFNDSVVPGAGELRWLLSPKLLRALA